MSRELAYLSATELVCAFRRRELSPLQVTEAVLARIEAHDGAVNAFCLVDAERALEAARASEQRWQRGEPRGLIDGVPVTIKDLILTRGWPTLRGSRTIHPDQPWENDAPATARLREHGAVLIGKTNTPELGWKGVTDSALRGITRNPWNTAVTPGGSSGGAAAACALGMGALHVGTDGGGSIRIPAGFTGIFGLKPTFGRVPAWPASPFGTVAHVGPMTRTVSDAALMLNVLAAPDARDWHALPGDGRDYRVGLEQGVHGLRIAFCAELEGSRVDPAIAALVARAADVFADLGARVEAVAPPFPDPHPVFTVHWFCGAARVLSAMSDAERALVDPGLLAVAAEGARYDLDEYLQAAAARVALGVDMSTFHQSWDLLLTPTLPIPAFEAGVEVPRSGSYAHWPDWTPFSFPFNLTQQPAASVPCGFTPEGLPAGLQIVGAKYADALVLRAARAYESTAPFEMPGAPATGRG